MNNILMGHQDGGFSERSIDFIEKAMFVEAQSADFRSSRISSLARDTQNAKVDCACAHRVSHNALGGVAADY